MRELGRGTVGTQLEMLLLVIKKLFGHFRQTVGVQIIDCNRPKQWASLVGHASIFYLYFSFNGVFSITLKILHM